ncbi:MAG: SDR family NAD(P)-dependent oxidoreductase [Xanthomonadales bacterium]|jgi:NAD(P)-dependent dehydrogenase (short-subunit alcohol dehydrogenase family)|nr:SDR family NAD(P)-dependent oxidoreductase [Xanthomonadales bacterium]
MPDKTAIVTGAAGSLGGELSKILVEKGWNVIMVDSNRAGLMRVYDRIGEDGPGAPVLHPMDLAAADPAAFEELLENVQAQFRRLDALVHCAAHFESLTPSEHIPPEDWLLSVQANLNAPWLLSAMALAPLRASGEGKLIFVLEDLDTVKGSYWGAYGVCKHALNALVNQMAEEYGSSDVSVRGIVPGPMRSAIRSKVYHSENPAELPSARPVAERIARFLNGQENWAKTVIDFRAPLNGAD